MTSDPGTAAGRFLAAVPALPVSNEQRAVEFLRDALGMTQLVFEGNGMGICRRDNVEIHVWVADGKAKGAERYLAGSASCRIQLTAIDALHEHCAALGVVHPNGPLRDTRWGTREFDVLDPDGNLITLFEQLPS